MMTEQEMRNRMKEIDNERNKLKEEREEYEKYFSNKRLKEQLNDHKQYIGKCFISKNVKQTIAPLLLAWWIVEFLFNIRDSLLRHLKFVIKL